MQTITSPSVAYIPVNQRYTLQQIQAMPMVVIAAKGRSGTTLLQSVLDAHPNIVVPPESKFVLYLGRFGKNRKFKKGDGATITNLLRYERKIVQLWRINLDVLQHDLEWAIEQGADYATLCKVIYLSYPAAVLKNEIMLLGDKNPMYSTHLPYLRSIFGNMRIIHLVREYHDCIASNYHTFKKKNIGITSSSWLHLNKEIEEYKVRHSQNCFTLIYEELCHHPETELNRLFDFLNVVHDPGVMKFNERILAGREFVKWNALKRTHPGLLNPINTSGIGKYKTRVTREQIQIIEIVCGPFATQYGYEFTLPPNERNKRLLLRKFLWKKRMRFTKLIIKLYYRMPYSVRQISHNLNGWLYKKTGFTTQYNDSELRLTDE